ncbi:MAG: hypothetical protein AB1411_06105 [Nitrospirota bacterium]
MTPQKASYGGKRGTEPYGGHEQGGHAPGHGSGPQAPKDKGIGNEPHQHAFVMLGTNTLFLCHLTMYQARGFEEHQYQVVLETKLPEWAMSKYREARLNDPDQTYFLGNAGDDLFTLPQAASRMRVAFTGNVFRGIPPVKDRYDSWPWEGVTPFIKNVRVTIERFVYYRLFSDNMDYPRSLTYIVFGASDEAHMTNYQTNQPDFDHILSLSKKPDWIPPAQLEAGILVDLPNVQRIPDKPPTAWVGCSNPLPKGSTQNVRYRAIGEKRPILIGPTYWFSTKVANQVNPCPDSAGR